MEQLEEFDLKELLNSFIISMMELNDRVIALEELAAEYLAQQGTE